MLALHEGKNPAAPIIAVVVSMQERPLTYGFRGSKSAPLLKNRLPVETAQPEKRHNTMPPGVQLTNWRLSKLRGLLAQLVGAMEWGGSS